MELNGYGAIFISLVASYSGLIIVILIFCVSVIALITKRNKLNNVIKIYLLILVIISISLIGISVYLGFVFGRPHSIGIIGGSDGPTIIYIDGSNYRR
jgi:Na+-transporting methylmalonyl-CoA/oxaloacetate decarboxylase beta subunit